jgi:cytochrome b6-f complex iron-sulfur subunit
MRRARRFVADLIRRRRPRAFPAGPEDTAELRAAIMLRAAAPGAGEPSEEFTTKLHNQLRTTRSTLSTPDSVPATRTRRAVIVRTTSVAAASAAIGAAAGVALRGDPPPPTHEATLTPNSGVWRTVAASDDLPDGGIQPFDLGTVVGFVQRAGGELRAVSGICTHLGCRLGLDAPNRRLNCPCHKTSFTPGGDVITHQLPTSPAPLPHIPVRESDGSIQVLAPPG